MPNYKATLASHAGSFDLPVHFSGPDVPAAIRHHWTENLQAKVISITEPFEPGDYFICHDGRRITLFNRLRQVAEVVYSDRVHHVQEVPGP